MTASEAALDNVHTLYILQTKFITSLDNGLRSSTLREELMGDMRTFQRLLNQADWRYMGGEDVLASLKQLHGEVKAKLKTSPAKKAKAVVVKAGKKAKIKKAAPKKKVKKPKKAKAAAKKKGRVSRKKRK